MCRIGISEKLRVPRFFIENSKIGGDFTRLKSSGELLVFQYQAHRGTDEQAMRWAEKLGVSMDS